MMEVTGILLVGGSSRRFGSVEGTCRARRRDPCRARLAPPRRKLLRASRVRQAGRRPFLFAFPLEDDECQVRAPLAGLVAGLRRASYEVSVVIPVDSPNLTTSALADLVAACRGHAAAVPQSGPLPGAYRKSALPTLERHLAAARLSIREALVELDVVTVELADLVLVKCQQALGSRAASDSVD